MKNAAFFAFTVLLITTLFAACDSPMGTGAGAAQPPNGNPSGTSNIDPADIPPADPPVIPQGMGIVNLTIETPPARTVLPTVPVITGYWVQFVINDAYYDTSSETIVNGDNGEFVLWNPEKTYRFMIDPDEYNIRIYACIGDPPTNAQDAINNSIAMEVKESIVVNNGYNPTIQAAVDLYDPAKGNGEGWFRWSINVTNNGLAGLLKSAVMEIEEIDVGENYNGYTEDNINLIEAAIPGKGERHLPSGYYSLLITMTSVVDSKIVVREIVHVYQNMTSNFLVDWLSWKYLKVQPGGSIVIVVMPKGPSEKLSLAVNDKANCHDEQLDPESEKYTVHFLNENASITFQVFHADYQSTSAPSGFFHWKSTATGVSDLGNTDTFTVSFDDIKDLEKYRKEITYYVQSNDGYSIEFDVIVDFDP